MMVFNGIKMMVASVFIANVALAESDATRAAREAFEAATENLKAYEALAGEIHQNTQNFYNLVPHLPPRIAGELQNTASPSAEARMSRLLVFLTLDMPDQSLKTWLTDIERAGGVAVIRGFYGNRFSTTLKRLNELGEDGALAGVQINSTAFKQFGIKVAPVVVVMASALPPCRSRGCADDAPPRHDRITGNITLESALEAISREGEEANAIADHHLARLNGDAS